nr:MAG TPA: hypothetical protein [Caudoviricetes sp.]DAM74105.1 MAG TPA: hypothetical protein [Caudoviricetes sp.]
MFVKDCVKSKTKVLKNQTTFCVWLFTNKN